MVAAFYLHRCKAGFEEGARCRGVSNLLRHLFADGLPVCGRSGISVATQPLRGRLLGEYPARARKGSKCIAWVARLPTGKIAIARRHKSRRTCRRSYNKPDGPQRAPQKISRGDDEDGDDQNPERCGRAPGARHQSACGSASPEVVTRRQFGSLARTLRSNVQTSVMSRTVLASPSVTLPSASVVAEMNCASNESVISAKFFFNW